MGEGGRSRERRGPSHSEAILLNQRAPLVGGRPEAVQRQVSELAGCSVYLPPDPKGSGVAEAEQPVPQRWGKLNPVAVYKMTDCKCGKILKTRTQWKKF